MASQCLPLLCKCVDVTATESETQWSMQYLEIVEAEDAAAATEQLEAEQAQAAATAAAAASAAQNGCSPKHEGSAHQQKPQRSLRMGFR